jgi:D-tyrosyl-tRNA(Tyr) deacylase
MASGPRYDFRRIAMRALVQRVSEASVAVEDTIVGQIGRGLLVFLGVHESDTETNADYLANKVIQLRIFPDDDGKMNLSLRDILGGMLVVSQFTLYGDTRKGNRPSYSQAARPEVAVRLYNYFIEICRKRGISVSTGVFQADMKVRLTNDGPVTLFCYSET